MTPNLQNTLSLLRRASNRAWLHTTLGRAAVGSVVGAGVGLGLVGLGKFVPLTWPWWWSLALSPIAGAAIGGVSALLSRWTSLRAARELESRLPLDDRLSSALQLAKSAPADPFVGVAILEAERLSAGIDVRSALPFSARRWWLASPALIAASAAVGLWVPSRASLENVIQAQVSARERDDAAARLAEIMPMVRDAAPSNAPSASDRDLAALEDVQRELSAEKLSPAEAASRSAQAVDRVAQRLEDQSRTDTEEFDRARRALAEAARARKTAPPDAGTGRASPSELSAIRRALEAGDVESAASAAEQTARDAQGMSAERRRALADDLAELGRALERHQAEPTRSEETEKKNDGTDGERPEPQGAAGTPKSSRESAIEKKDAQKSSAERLARAMKDAAEELKNEKLAEGSAAPEAPRQDQAAEDTRANDEKPPKKNADGSKNSAESANPGANKPAGTSEPRSPESAPAAGPKPASGASENKNRGENREKSENTREKSGKKDGQDRGAQEGARENSRTSTEATAKKDSEGNEPKPNDRTSPGSDGPENTDKPEASKPGNSASERPSPSQPTKSEGRRTEGSEAERPEDGGEPGSTPSADRGGKTAMERLAKELRELGDKPDRARTNSQNAREMRERAREMLENASPEQRKELEQLARAMQKEARKDAGDRPQNGEPAGERGSRSDSQSGDQSGRKAGGQGDGQVSKDREFGSAQGEPTDSDSDQSSSPPGDRGSTPQVRDGRRPPSNSGGKKTELLDARPKPADSSNGRAGAEPETVISAWSGPPEKDGSSTARERTTVAERFKSAAAGAERSVEQQAVPPRYGDLVRRVFRKYVERTGASGAAPERADPSPGPSLAPDAADVVRPK